MILAPTRVYCGRRRILDAQNHRSALVAGENQLNKAVRAPPTCRYPVGDGANRTRTRRCILGVSVIFADRFLEFLSPITESTIRQCNQTTLAGPISVSLSPQHHCGAGVVK